MPIARMNNCSSTARLAATDWLVSRQCTSSAPCSLVPVGSVPGIRLESAQNALRSPPGGRRNGQTTNPGFSFKLRLSARRATSVPETTDWRKKFARSAASEASLNRDAFGGRKRKLVHVAPATAGSPIGRSAGAHPEIMSQKTRKSADRPAAARARRTGALSAGALKGRPNPPNRSDARSLGRLRKDLQAGNLAVLIAQAARHPRLQPLRCDAAQRYHVPPDKESSGRRRARATNSKSAAAAPAPRDSPRAAGDQLQHRSNGSA